MQTRLSLFCDKVIEAGLLILAALIPLFLNPFSWTIFEPDKTAMMRSVTLILVLAWVVRALERGSLWKGKEALRKSLRFPLVIPTLLFLGAILLATVTSVAPRLSLWGSYRRPEGAYTLLCYVALFFLGLGVLRRLHQIERLVTAILMASLPVSLYAIMQHYGLDPLPWKGLGAEVTFRAASTQGNAIFLAAYLIMVIPLTVARFFDSFSTFTRKATCPSITLVSYALLLSVQILTLLFTQSRGPLLGLMSGMAYFFLMWTVVRGRWRWTLAVIGMAAGLLLLLILLNIPDGPLAPLRELPYLERLSQLLNPQAWGVRERILGWEGVSHLITADPARTIIGYGPDTLTVVLYPYYPREMAPLMGMLGKALLGRAHNRIFDILAGAGVVGLSAYLLLIGSLFYYGLKWLGLLQEPHQRSLFASCLVLGGVLGFLLPLLLDHSLKFVGVGIALGVVSALGMFLVASALLRRKKEKARWGSTTSLTLIALLGALVAHFTEVQFGIATASTNILFWLFAAMTAVLVGRFQTGETSHPQEATAILSAPRKEGRRRRSKRRTKPLGRRKMLKPENIPMVVYSLLSGLILTALIYAFVGSGTDLSQHHSSGIWFLLFTWILLGGLAVTIPGLSARTGSTAGTSHQNDPEWLPSFGLFLLLSGGCALLFGTFYQSIMQSGGQGTQGIVVFSLWLLFLLLALGTVLTREVAGPTLTWRKGKWWAHALLIVVTMALAIETNLNMVIADVHLKQGVLLLREKQWESAIFHYRKAVKAAPYQAMYHQCLGAAYLERWRDASQRQGVWLQESREALERAAGISPLDPNSLACLGSVYLLSAETMSEPSERERYLRRASSYYQEAASLSPWPADVYREWGQAYHDLGLYEEAIEKYRQALDCDEGDVETYLALGDAYEALGRLDQAIEAYKAGSRADPDSVDAYSSLAYEYALKGEMEKAIEVALKAAELEPDNYLVHQNLAVYHREAGKFDRAVAEAQLALESAPESGRALLEDLIAQSKQLLASAEAEERATEGQGGERLPARSDLEPIERYLSQGATYLEAGEWDKAAEMYSQALTVDPDHVGVHSALGYVYYHQGRLEDAVKENLTIVRLEPRDYTSHMNLALIYQEMGHLQKALAEAQLALAFAPQEQKPPLRELITQLETLRQGNR